ncbi:hypothetical protein GCM10028832_07610 [Streptomyces sparsus]
MARALPTATSAMVTKDKRATGGAESAGGKQPDCTGRHGSTAVPPPSRMHQRERTIRPATAQGERAAAAMWPGPPWALR